MKQVIISLQVQSQRHRHSLAALLASMPGVQVLPVGSVLKPLESGSTTPDLLLFEGSSSNAEHIAAIHRARLARPGLKTILLVDSNQPDPNARLDGVDLILPVNTTAGELFYSIDRLTGRAGTTSIPINIPV